MRITDAIKTLADWDRRHGRDVFTLTDLRRIFHRDSPRSLDASLSRLIREGFLERVANGVFVNPLSHNVLHRPERIALALRPGEFSYVSLECALSDWGVISQVPQGYLTVMTTGRKGTFRLPHNGVIEFTHTSRTPDDIAESTVGMGSPLRMATARAALRDLRRVGRNLHLVDMEEMRQYE